MTFQLHCCFVVCTDYVWPRQYCKTVRAIITSKLIAASSLLASWWEKLSSWQVYAVDFTICFWGKGTSCVRAMVWTNHRLTGCKSRWNLHSFFWPWIWLNIIIWFCCWDGLIIIKCRWPESDYPCTASCRLWYNMLTTQFLRGALGYHLSPDIVLCKILSHKIRTPFCQSCPAWFSKSTDSFPKI